MKIRRLLTLVLIVVSPIIVGQTRAQRSSGPTEKVPPKEKPNAKAKIPTGEEESVKAFQKDQAVQLLRDALSSSSSIQDVGERSQLVSRAAELIWGYDQQAARLSLSKTFEDLLSQYKDPKVVQSIEKLGLLDEALIRLIASMMRKDANLAASAQQHLEEMRKENLKEGVAGSSNKERFSLAQESLGSNLQKSVELAGGVLQTGVPLGFPQFLYDLRRADISSADALFARGLTVLASGRVYRARDAIQLSVYAFRERMVLLPTPDAGDQSAKLQFGMFTKELSPPEYGLDPAVANPYLAAAFGFLTRQLQINGVGRVDTVQLVQSLFLATKLGVYSSRLGLSRADMWQQLKFDLVVRCKNANIDTATIQNITGFAERLAATDEVFQFGDDSSLNSAKDIKDQKRRNEVLVRGIWNLIQAKRFQQAETRIKEVDEKDVRETLNDLLGYYAGKANWSDGNWIEVGRRASLIKDVRIGLLLLLESAKAARAAKGPERNITKQFLLDARALIPGVSNRNDRAKGLISIASLAAETYPQLSVEMLPEVLSAINASDNYDGGDFQILIDVLPQFRVALSSADSNLDVWLKRQAKVDWTNALRLAADIDSKRLRTIALLSACGAIL
jgi:hypothetical protein